MNELNEVKLTLSVGLQPERALSNALVAVKRFKPHNFRTLYYSPDDDRAIFARGDGELEVRPKSEYKKLKKAAKKKAKKKLKAVANPLPSPPAAAQPPSGRGGTPSAGSSGGRAKGRGSSRSPSRTPRPAKGGK